MAADGCIDGVAKAGGLTKDEALAALDDVDQRAQALMRKRGLSSADAHVEAAREITAEDRIVSAVKRQQAVENLAKRVELRNRVAARAMELKDRHGIPNLGKALSTELSAIETKSRVTGGNRYSIEADWKTREKTYLGGLKRDLKNAGLLQVAKSGKLDKEINEEWAALNTKEPGGPKPGVSGSDVARQIAEIFNKYDSMSRVRLNRAGAWIGHYEGHTLRTVHNAGLLYKAGFEQWKNDILPELDAEATFGEDDPNKFLRSVWDSRTTGVSLKTPEMFKDPAFIGPSNIAKRLSKERILHFKDADSWFRYEQKYAEGTIAERLAFQLRASARAEALMNRLGTNPEAEMKATMKWLEQQPQFHNQPTIQKFGKWEKNINDLMGELTGANNIPKNEMAAKLAAGARNIENMAKLGGVLWTHVFSALTTGSGELRFHGIGLGERFLAPLRFSLQGLTGNQAREFLDLVDAGVDGMHTSLAAPWTVDDALPGALSKTSAAFHELTGLPTVVRWIKDGVAAMVGRKLGRHVGQSWEQLPERLRHSLNVYGFTPAEWDALRTAPDHLQVRGRTYLTPDAADRSPAEMSPFERDMLAMKLRTYYQDIANRFIVTPTIADRRLARFTDVSAPGTALGEATRFIAQFKSWPIAAMRQVVARDLNVSKSYAISSIVGLAVSATIFGYMRMSVMALAEGKEPPALDSWATVGAAAAQSGGFGILGDYLFGQGMQNRFGQGIGETALGPVLGEIPNAIMTMWNNAKAGKWEHLPSEMVHLGLQNTPFVNLFYLRSALNYLFIYSLLETMNPGYLNRMQNRMRKEQGQSYLSPAGPMGWMAPQNHLHTFGR